MIDAGIHSHHLMRASLAAFQCRFSELSVSQKEVVENTARKSIAIESAVLSSEEAMGIHLPDSIIDEALDNVKGRYDSGSDFEDDLAANALDEPTLKVALARELRVDAVLTKIAQDVALPSDDELRQWYGGHLEKFSVPEMRTARHILITVNDAFPENVRGKARLKIQSILETLDGSSTQFQMLAKQHSECPTALEGGMLGKIPRGKLFAILDETLFAMEKGSISDIVESEMGFHILLCEDIHAGLIVPFSEAREKISDHLLARKRHAVQKRWIEGLVA